LCITHYRKWLPVISYIADKFFLRNEDVYSHKNFQILVSVKYQNPVFFFFGDNVNNGSRRDTYRILVQKSEGKRPAEDLGIDGTVLKWILRILWYDIMTRSGVIWLRTETSRVLF
jgi:hypothetical protein